MTNNSADSPAAYAATRHDGWTPARQAHFLRALAQGGSVSAACAAVGKSCASAYRLRRRPDAAAFAAAWDLCVLPHFAVRQQPRRSRFDRRPFAEGGEGGKGVEGADVAPRPQFRQLRPACAAVPPSASVKSSPSP